jgi:hypothetical protein
VSVALCPASLPARESSRCASLAAGRFVSPHLVERPWCGTGGGHDGHACGRNGWEVKTVAQRLHVPMSNSVRDASYLKLSRWIVDVGSHRREDSWREAWPRRRAKLDPLLASTAALRSSATASRTDPESTRTRLIEMRPSAGQFAFAVIRPVTAADPSFARRLAVDSDLSATRSGENQGSAHIRSARSAKSRVAWCRVG